MWRKAMLSCSVGALQKQAWRTMATLPSARVSTSTAVNSIILRSLKDHYLEVSKMTPPPKVSPPSPFMVVKGALDSGGAVLKRSYGDEEISISVMRMANIVPGGPGEDDDDDDDDDDGINQLFVHVDIAKPGYPDSLQFLCGLYPDALGIHSVSMRPKIDSSGFALRATGYYPVFENVGEKMRDALHGYIEERGINDSLFSFLQAWLYVKDHRNLMRWFKSVGSFVTEAKEETS